MIDEPLPQPTEKPTQASSEIPTVESRDLMKGGREVRIHHNGEWYRLTITRNEKLILHK